MTEMPFTLAHPAAVLPLLRHPFVPAALVAGSMAPDVPYFLNAAGITSTSAADWYEPLLNATHSHALSGLPISLLYAVILVAAYWLVRAPATALLPPGLSLPQRDRPKSAQYALWLLLSALIGVATHDLWDALTDADLLPASRLLQYASTAFGLAVVAWFLWKRRTYLRTPNATPRLGTAMRRLVIVLLIAAPLLGAAALAHDDYNTYRTVTEVDYNQPITVDEGNGVTSTTYPTTTVPASWATLTEGVLTGAAKRAGAAFAIATLLYATTWQLVSRARDSRKMSGV